MSAAGFALVLRPDASFEITEWPGDSTANLRTLYTAIGCTHVDVVDLSPKVSMWLDDDGIHTGAPVNKWATLLYAITAPLHQNYYGTAVFTGGPDAQGDTTGLTRDSCDALLELAGIETK
ncbi:DUF3846 domain-containing protein [Streptomyces collinus]|uniref:DUF3846 domain-containing protein n=1 Tax=Streptomyces collinus TaxID=42684 RepID=UPI0036A2B15B